MKRRLAGEVDICLYSQHGTLNTAQRPQISTTITFNAMWKLPSYEVADIGAAGYFGSVRTMQALRDARMHLEQPSVFQTHEKLRSDLTSVPLCLMATFFTVQCHKRWFENILVTSQLYI
jgi:hypothetical protein